MLNNEGYADEKLIGLDYSVIPKKKKQSILSTLVTGIYYFHNYLNNLYLI